MQLSLCEKVKLGLCIFVRWEEEITREGLGFIEGMVMFIYLKIEISKGLFAKFSGDFWSIRKFFLVC